MRASDAGRLIIEWNLSRDDADGSPDFDWSLTQDGPSRLSDDGIEALLSPAGNLFP
jgi:hypothetical protein